MSFSIRIARLVFPVLLSLAAGKAVAQPALSRDFSGTYVEQTEKRMPSSSLVQITIKQVADHIEITHLEAGRTSISTFPLDGTQGVYTTPTGVTGTGMAHWKGSDLLIETFIVSPPINGKTIRFHTKERWQISGDGKKLKVHAETDSPDLAPEIMAAAIQPYTLVYLRAPAP